MTVKDKILFWIDMEWLKFCIAKFLQQNYDCQLYAIFDTDKISTNFFKKQKIVNFEKTWFYRDYIKNDNDKIDIAFLQNFEKKYGINLWEVAYSERFFFNYNPYHKFNYNEIVTILEKECKLFESVLDEVKPDYLIIKLTDSHQSHLIHQLCKARGIKVLMMGPTRFAYRYAIYQDYDNLGNIDFKNYRPKNLSLSELQNYLNKYNAVKETKDFEAGSKVSFFNRMRRYWHFIMSVGDSDFKSYYANFGKTRLKIMFKFIFLKRWYRKSFIDKNFSKSIDADEKFIYFPLHVEPERSLLLVAPFHTNQIEIITQIAKALPIGFKLYVKEHVGMSIYGWRERSYYQKILSLPNVCLIHPSVNSIDLLKKCSLVITIGGTTGVEAAFHLKPTVVFADVGYSMLSSIYRLRNVEELPQVINKMISMKVETTSLECYLDHVENNSFNCDLTSLYIKFNNYFYEEFNSIKNEIDDSKMESFLDTNRKELGNIALEHIKKIKYYKMKENQ